MKKIILTGGGTAGHVTPNIALMPKLKELGYDKIKDRYTKAREKLRLYPDVKLVIITSPTYEGVISDVRAIAEVCHGRGIPLMVDEAHGAHLGLYGIFSDGAVKCGADVVVQSIHKTLPSLTQTALLHLNGDLICYREIKRQMAIFQTSSPSYILSASIDGAVRFLASADGEKCLREWYRAVTETRERLSILQNAYVFDGLYDVYDLDVSKLVFRGGPELASVLREYNVEPEMVSKYYTVAMTGAGDTPETMDALASAAEAADGIIHTYGANIPMGRTHVPACQMSIAEAVLLPHEYRKGYEAVGKVSAGYVYAYPPGIPLCVPGEIIDDSAVTEALELMAAGIDLRGFEKLSFLTVRE